MKRIPIAELEGAALDWAVAKAAYPDSVISGDRLRVKATVDGELCTIGSVWIGRPGSFTRTFEPSSSWLQCGPLIERYKVEFREVGGLVLASPGFSSGFWGKDPIAGECHLIAACRAIVAARNPDGFVDVPDGLYPQ